MHYLKLPVLTGLLLVFSFSIALAHDYWIIPETFTPKENTTVKTDFTSAHTFFASEELPDITKFQLLQVNPDGRAFPLAYSRVAPEAAKAEMIISGPGTYIACAVSTIPSYWTQTRDKWYPAKKNEIEGAVKGSKSVKSVKTFLTSGKPSNTFGHVLGFEIEMIPQKDPATLKASEPLPVQVLFRGKPAEAASVSAIFEGFVFEDKSKPPFAGKTDPKGIINVELSKTGKWLVIARHQIQTPENPLADTENYVAYMMFEIK